MIAGILLAIVFQAAALAQRIREVPVPITFSEWREIETDDENARELEVVFPSPYLTGVAENDVVPLRIFLPKQKPGPYPSVIVLHYWGSSDQKIERSLAGDLVRQGIAAVLITLPYHLQRTPPGRRSGELAIQPDPDKLIATMTQAVQDVRRAVDFIVSRPEFDPARIGIAGTSLGSIVSSLSLALEPRLACASFMLGGADLAHILWHSSRIVPVRDGLRRRGFTESRLREALVEVEPLRYLSERRVGPTFVIGGKFDTVIPPADTRKLVEALPSAETLWLDTGHYGGVFVQRRVLRLVSNFFAGQFGGPPFVPPKSIYAPTVRILVEANLDSGAQVGIGLDLWRTNARGDLMATAIATPRGPQLFLGGRLDKGLTLGVFVTPRRVSPGLMWSTVL